MQPQTLNSCLVAFYFYSGWKPQEITQPSYFQNTSDMFGKCLEIMNLQVHELFVCFTLSWFRATREMMRNTPAENLSWRWIWLRYSTKVRFSVSVLYVVGLFLPQSFIWLGIVHKWYGLLLWCFSFLQTFFSLTATLMVPWRIFNIHGNFPHTKIKFPKVFFFHRRKMFGSPKNLSVNHFFLV